MIATSGGKATLGVQLDATTLDESEAKVIEEQIAGMIADTKRDTFEAASVSESKSKSEPTHIN